MAAPKVLLIVAHPVIASGIETLLRLEGDYDIKRVASVSDATKPTEWRADVALVDGTLLASYSDATIGVPTYVLSGSERDGRQLARKLDQGRGWLRKDATGPELRDAIESLMKTNAQSAAGGGVGMLGIVTIAVLCMIVLALVAYLIWLAVY